jgi:transcriptional regulator with XRE-family HTH domain
MRLLYLKPKLKDLSQGSRIAFIRQFRFMSQDDVSEKLGLSGECKRRTMTRYERDQRKPSNKRLNELSKILQVNINSIKQYNFENIIDLIYLFLWLEELYPRIRISIPDGLSVVDKDKEVLNKCLSEWNRTRDLKDKSLISFYEYMDWKFNYEIEER